MIRSTTHLPAVFLNPGDIFVDRRPHLVTTVLGSCVAVCLWDARRRCGGMTHSILPEPLPGDDPSPRHTQVAVERLFEDMQSLGSRPGDLRAKLFGGANLFVPHTSGWAAGPANVDAALAALERLRLPVLAREVLGGSGLVIKMNTGLGDVWLRRIVARQVA